MAGRGDGRSHPRFRRRPGPGHGPAARALRGGPAYPGRAGRADLGGAEREDLRRSAPADGRPARARPGAAAPGAAPAVGRAAPLGGLPPRPAADAAAAAGGAGSPAGQRRRLADAGALPGDPGVLAGELRDRRLRRGRLSPADAPALAVRAPPARAEITHRRSGTSRPGWPGPASAGSAG